jgi:hypothetical protein
MVHARYTLFLRRVISCDSPNNNLYHQRVAEADRRDYTRSVDISVAAPSIPRPSTSNEPEVINIDSHETSHSSIAEALNNLVTKLQNLFSSPSC